MNTPIFYIALFAHLSCLNLAFGSFMVIDVFGLLWLLGKQTLAGVNKVAGVTQRLIWIGWAGLVLSGSVLIYHKGYIDHLTQVKIFFVLMVGLNGLYLHRIKKSFDTVTDETNIPKLLLFRIALATTISQTGWWGAMFIGFVHRQLWHTINWPEKPYIWMAAIALTFLGTGLLGEKLLREPKKA